MSVKKFAILTECPDGTYEIFHIVRLLSDSEFGISRISRFETALNENKEVVGMNVSSYLNAKYNAIWDGVQFISDQPPAEQDSHEVSRYAFMYDNTVFFMLGFDKNSITDQKFEAAMSQNIIVKDVTEYPDSILGWIWNGVELVDPNNV